MNTLTTQTPEEFKAFIDKSLFQDYLDDNLTCIYQALFGQGTEEEWDMFWMLADLKEATEAEYGSNPGDWGKEEMIKTAQVLNNNPADNNDYLGNFNRHFGNYEEEMFGIDD